MDRVPFPLVRHLLRPAPRRNDFPADPGYGRAYAAAIPGARFELLPGTGHLPQLETPEQLMRAAWDFTGAVLPHRE
jgi:pimeloyl-ACP methyl ester carboxylesterase